MYIRFVCNRPHPRVPAEAGIFDAYWRLGETLEAEVSPRISRRGRGPRFNRVRNRHYLALRAAVAAFTDLDGPKLRGAGRLRGGRAGLFWFRTDAAWQGHHTGTVVQDAWGLVYELARWGVEIRAIESADPGRVLWSDPYQVLAVPSGPVPRAFA